MTTLHPSASKRRDGFAPMVILRNAKGQCVGSIAGRHTYSTKCAARIMARAVAHKAQASIGFAHIRVA